MKVAILADLHGNPIALDRVLEDIQSTGGVDEYWLLGDYAAIGYDPVGTLERVSRLPGARFIRGNTDHYLCTGKLPGPQLADVVHKSSQEKYWKQIPSSHSLLITFGGRMRTALALPSMLEPRPVFSCLTWMDRKEIVNLT